MRISTANAFDNGVDILSRRQAEMTSLQDQLTTGKRISKASDDPAGAARAERARASIGRSETQGGAHAFAASKERIAHGFVDCRGLGRRRRKQFVQAFVDCLRDVLEIRGQVECAFGFGCHLQRSF